MTIRLAVFDAYGTLFDISGAARAAAAEPGGQALADCWPVLSDLWRRKQLEYSWLRAVMGAHANFWTVTGQALDYAIDAVGADPALRPRLMALYRRLPAYPEVEAALLAIRAQGVRTAILSNGAPDMLVDAVEAAGLRDLLDAVISVEEVGVFKPDPRVYALAARRFGAAENEVLFVSSNGWDIAGAARFGFRTLWVNRAGAPRDRLPHGPAHEAPDLSAAPALLTA
jgi:2-haloacid dehalogenase